MVHILIQQNHQQQLVIFIKSGWEYQQIVVTKCVKLILTQVWKDKIQINYNHFMLKISYFLYICQQSRINHDEAIFYFIKIFLLSLSLIQSWMMNILLYTMVKSGLIPLLLFLCILTCVCIGPTRQPLMYPNTQNSPSFYLLSFSLTNPITKSSYLLITLDWYASSISPFHCLFVNSSISIRCTNLASPTFALSISAAKMLNYNFKLTTSKTVVVQINSSLLANTEYILQLHLYNVVPNIKKISPSIEIYAVSLEGLIYEQNLNFGPTINMAPFNNLMTTSIINSLANNEPGQLSTLRAEFSISVAISTPLSSFVFVIPQPFYFSTGTIIRSYSSESYATNPISLYKAPILFSSQIKSSNLFEVVFNQSFVIGRKFILEVTEIQNPYYLAKSNISIYSMDYGSLTPKEGFQQLYPIETKTFALTVIVGLPYDTPIQGPCQLYRNKDQYMKVKFQMVRSVPAGYAIRLKITEGYLHSGLISANFQSLNYTTKYYFPTTNSQYVILSGMGPIATGTNVEITFKMYKDNVTTLNVNVRVDTESIITAGTASQYMFQGNGVQSATDADTFYNNIYDSVFGYGERVSSVWSLGTDYLKVFYLPTGTATTSTNSYMDFYLSPLVKLHGTFNPLTDCSFGGTANSATCTIEQTSNYLRITVKPTTSYSNSTPNAFPYGVNTQVRILRILFPTTSSPNNLYQTYFRLFRTDGVSPVEYITSAIFVVLPPFNTTNGLTVQHHSTTATQGVNYPTFVRFQSTTPATMSYVLQQNQRRVVTLFSLKSFRGYTTLQNQDQYPCSSNINVICKFEFGNVFTNQLNQWYRIHILFSNNQESTTSFHVIIPDIILVADNQQYNFLAGKYNELTKDYTYIYRNTQYFKGAGGFSNIPTGLQPTMSIDLQGKAGSYRDNVNVTVVTGGGLSTSTYSMIVIITKWSFYEKGISSLSNATKALANPTFGTNIREPVSIYLGSFMYMTVIPYLYTSSISTFTFTLNGVHMPYTYDLPDYRIYIVEAANNYMTAYNEYLMTFADIFYESTLKSLTVSCLDNSLGVVNTLCTITFGTQHPLKANGTIRIVFDGMTVATDKCKLTLANGTVPSVNCSTSQDNRNLTVVLNGGIDHYPAGTFYLDVYGIGIDVNAISQSMAVYLMDSFALYSIEKGTRIITTKVVTERSIQIFQITYKYSSPLSSNVISIKFFLPRVLYDDQQLGFIMGKDLSDVNNQIKRLDIILYDSSDNIIKCLYDLISAQYKVLFSFITANQILQGNYSIKIYGIMTPASHTNGDFQIIYQRKKDKIYSLINSNNAAFPAFSDRIISDITIDSFYNTEGYDQQIRITILNRNLKVDDSLLWIVNFPSYYIDKLFNYAPYCLIDGTPIQCVIQTLTPFQLLIRKSPKIIQTGNSYVLTILGISCPRKTYMNNTFPSRYIFVGMLASDSDLYYQETALLYPQQSIQQYVPGIVTLYDIPVASTTQPAFSSIYATLNIRTNIAIAAGSYLYIEFPPGFDNFNNQKIDTIITINGSIPVSRIGQFLGNRVEILFNSSLGINSAFSVGFPNLPTPRNEVTVVMSQTSVFFTPSDKKSISAASMISGNSAPTLKFVKDLRYISLNNDNIIQITAGTYSSLIDIKSSDNNAFLTNIVLNISSNGFIFIPSSIFMKLGDKKATMRVGADNNLLPISYFYSTIKQDEVVTLYTITTNNNIRVTNVPVTITIPASISVPQGGCSTPFNIMIANPPFSDILISFSYDNTVYTNDVFWPNHQTTKSQMAFSIQKLSNLMSFCASNSLAPTSFKMQLVLSGTNYASYKFSPSSTMTINIGSEVVTPLPSISLALTNQQSNFLEITLTTNIQGNIFYQMSLIEGKTQLNLTAIQLKIKENILSIKNMSEYMTRIYTTDRDQRIGVWVEGAGSTIKKIQNLLPQKNYQLCVYLSSINKVVSPIKCLSLRTSNWGTISKFKVTFTKTLNDQQLNNVLCYFTKSVATEVYYLTDLQGNSCNNRKVKNINFFYNATTFSAESKSTFVYLITNPYKISDSSQNILQSMYNSDKSLTSGSLASALNSYAINYLSSTILTTSNVRAMTVRETANDIQVSFTAPFYTSDTNTVTVPLIQLNQPGTVYFVMVLYKTIYRSSNQTYVNIRMNVEPTVQQIVNCQTWAGIRADGCARAVYSSLAVNVTFSSISPNSMYLLYYVAANEYPLRPILSSNIFKENIVTFLYSSSLLAYILILLLSLFVMI